MSKKTSITIVLIVEGKSEQNYFNGFKQEINSKFENRFKFTILCANGGGYSKFSSTLKQYINTEIPVFIVADLDRAIGNHYELDNLKKLINEIKGKDFYNIFLTNKNFETFIAYNFQSKKIEIVDYDKNDKRIYEKISQKNGSFEIAKKNFNSQKLFFYKDDKNTGCIAEESLHEIQSSLVNIVSYCELIEASRK